MSSERAVTASSEAWAEAWAASHRDPYLFATKVLGFLPHGSEPDGDKPILEKWQSDFLKGFFIGSDGNPVADPRHSVRSGHGCAKTCTIAILALWFVTTHYDAKCVITAASQDQLRDGAWSELRKWSSILPVPLREQLEISEERVVVKAAPEMGFVVRRTASKANPVALAGVHAKFVLYLIDEASGIDNLIFEVAAGSLSTEGAMAAMFSNPTKTSGFFFDTHNKMRDRWRCWRVSSEDVPRARGHIADVIAAYGKDSNKYRVRVLGEFPTQDDDTVIPLELIEAAKGRKVEAHAVWPVWALDVSRFGDDRTVLTKRQGNIILEPPTIWRNLSSTQIAGRTIEEYRRTTTDMKPEEVCIDVIGYGAGVVDALDERGSPFRGKVSGINVAESASVSGKYHRLRDELWWKGRQWFEAKNCSIPEKGCEELIAELATPTYDFTATGVIAVCSKSEMKKDLGFSPDIADSFLLSLAAGVYPREPDRHRRFRERPRNSDPWSA